MCFVFLRLLRQGPRALGFEATVERWRLFRLLRFSGMYFRCLHMYSELVGGDTRIAGAARQGRICERVCVSSESYVNVRIVSWTHGIATVGACSFVNM